MNYFRTRLTKYYNICYIPNITRSYMMQGKNFNRKETIVSLSSFEMRKSPTYHFVEYFLLFVTLAFIGSYIYTRVNEQIYEADIWKPNINISLNTWRIDEVLSSLTVWLQTHFSTSKLIAIFQTLIYIYIYIYNAWDPFYTYNASLPW